MKTIEFIRHSFAHVLALAVQRLYTGVRFGIGPVTDTGFFYDFKFKKEAPTEKDLEKIEKEMRKIIKENFEFKHEEVSAEKARKQLKNQPFKLELIRDLEKQEVQITLYSIGEFTDLCRGGHVGNTGDLPADAFKLTHIAGAYWRGSEKNPMLTRIYGAAFKSKKELDEHLRLQEELKRRDHRIIGKDLDLFTFSEYVGAGLPLFTPKGVIIRNEIEKYLEKLQLPRGYKKVWIPHLAKKELYETSGHWEKFGDDIFHVYSGGEFSFVLKPMNCPHHTQIYASHLRSYKDLPIRYFEVTEMYRDEKPGQLQGLTRVRAITIDDAHVFCTPEQIHEEVNNIYNIVEEFYKMFDMKLTPRLSLRDPADPKKYIGDPAKWDEAEGILRSILKERVGSFEEIPGEAAFYGPKIDFEVEDVLRRKWQLATIQLDFAMPERFNLSYIDSDGAQKRVVMIHRAISGSLERFMAILIEHYAGAFPFWLSPVQVAVLPISDKVEKYAQHVTDELQEKNIRVWLDDRNESIGKKIREAEIQKIPYSLIVGEKEEGSSTVSVRERGQRDLGTMKLEKFLKTIEDKRP